MDDVEFKMLYDSCSRYCMITLQKWTKNRQDAEDAFAEAISTYWIRYKQGKIKNHNNIKAYIFKIALNNHRNKMKIDQRMVDSALLNLEHIPDDLPNQFEQESVACQEVRQAFKKLSDDCQKMLTSKYVYGYRYEDIAKDMGRTSGNSVKVQTFRCAQYLLKMIDSIRNKMTTKH